MSAATGILAQIRSAGGQILATPDGRLRWCVPSATLADRLEPLVRANRSELLSLLRHPPAPSHRPARKTYRARGAFVGPCPCGADHRPCALTGRCGLECGCALCAGWRCGLAGGRVQ